MELRKVTDVAADAARRLGEDPWKVQCVYDSIFRGMRRYLIDAHNSGDDPRQVSGSVKIRNIGTFFTKPGRKPDNKQYKRRKE